MKPSCKFALDQAIEALDQAASRPLDTWQEDMIAAVRWLINATAEIAEMPDSDDSTAVEVEVDGQ